MARLNLLVGDCGSDVFSDLIRDIVVEATKRGVRDFHVMWNADDIVRVTGSLRIGLHVLRMNNLWYPGRETADFDLTTASLDFMRALRAATEAPIVAVFGYPDDADYPDRLYKAGADFVNRGPFETKPFQAEVSRLLSRSPASS